MPTEVDVIIVGAGAAGIVAALSASEHPYRVLLLEKTKRIGTKILISGGGKCNITHAGTIRDILASYRPNEAAFLRPSFYRYPPERILDVLHARGIETYTRPDGRIFPIDQTAKDVVRALHEELQATDSSIQFDAHVMDIVREEDRFIVKTLSGSIACKALILCVGGCSYPNSGTTGDGYAWARNLGHSIVEIRAALAPVKLKHPKPDLSGLALRNVVAKARASGKTIAKWRGDLLITHGGLSGPTILGISREVDECLSHQVVTIEADLCPDASHEDLQAEWTDLPRRSPHRKITHELERIVPERFTEEVCKAAQIPADLSLKQLDKKSRNRLVEVLKAMPFGPVSRVDLDKAEVTAGGVALDEVDPHSMASKIVPGLFFAGEILDIAGPVGGYNLQAAWSTGFVAGQSAAEFVAKSP